jgi:hypothetical protein
MTLDADTTERVTGDHRTGLRRVCLWFGSHVIAEYSAAEAIADEYATAIGRRFSGLTVTVDDEPTDGLRPVPAARLWDLAPR